MSTKPDKKPSNLVVLPATGWAPTNKDVSRALREWATHIEKAEEVFGNVILVMEVDGSICRRVIGGPIDRVRVMGILFDAATRAVGECAGWGDQDPLDE